MKKRILSAILVLVMVVGMIPGFTLTAYAASLSTTFTVRGMTYTVTLTSFTRNSTGDSVISEVTGINLSTYSRSGNTVSFYLTVGNKLGNKKISFTDSDCSKALTTAGTATSNNYTAKVTITRAAASHKDLSCDDSSKCSLCGTSAKLAHSTNGTYKSDGTYHWLVCSNDSSHQVNKAACSGGTATCEAKAVCTTCKNAYGATPSGHTWVWFNDGATNGNTHWQECANAGCDAKQNEGTCSGGTAYCREKAICDTCKLEYGGYTDSHPASAITGYEQIEIHYEDRHKFYCSMCDDWWVEQRACEEIVGYVDCANPATCVCGRKIYSNDHEYGNWVSNGNGTHTRNCIRNCGESETKNCSGGTATCAAAAVCSVCEESYGSKAAHSLTHSVRNGTTNVLVESCPNGCGHSATATLSATNQFYTGSAITSATITYSEGWAGSKDTEISYTDNVNVGTATATITVEGQTLSTTFQITAASIADATVTLNPESGTYTGTTYEPSISIVWNGITLAEGVDYTFGWYNTGLTEVGDYIVNIYGEGNFAGNTTKTFTVNAASLSNITVAQVGTLTYTGEAQTPTVSASATAVNGQTVTFTYLYEDEESEDDGRGESYGALPRFTEAGTYTVKYEASAPNHKSSCGEFTVTVDKAVVIEPDLGSVPYNGEVQRADIEDNDIYRITHQHVGAVPLKYNHTLKLNDPENYKWSTTDDDEVNVYFEITKAENAWITEPSISGWTYGETANAPTYEAKFGEVTVVYTGTANDGTAYNSETAPTKAGSYVATFTVEDEWRFSGLAATVDFTIAKADYDMSSAKWDYTDAFKYDGKEHKVEVVGLPTGVAVSGYEGNTATVVGNYTAKVTLSYDTSNYNAPSVADLNWSIENTWTPSEYTVNGDGWMNHDFVITANDGYKVSLTNTADGEWSDTLTGAVEGENSITFYVKNETTGAISLAKTVSYKLDKNTEATGTTGKVYFDERSGWESFLNTITFGLFYKDEVTVKVEATDKLSGVAKIEYFAADKAMTLEEVKAITTWTAYENGVTVTVEDAKQFVYFVRITDNAGNVTYLSTDGAEYDTTAPAISGIESGKTYYTTQKVTVTDRNIESITLNGETASESTALEGNKEATYTIVATDKAGNTTTVTVMMKPIADVDTTIDGITDDDVTSDDKETVQDVIDEIDELLKDEDLTDDEKAALEEIKDNAEKLIDKIGEADAAEETENIKKAEDVTAENVTPEDKTDLENAKSDLEKALEDYGDNYTDEEKKAIEDEIKRIDDALEIIGNVENVEELIDKLPENITKADEDAIKAAADAYNALSDYEKSLVDEAAKKALDDAKAALAELNKPDDSTSPNNLWWWLVLLFVIGAVIFAIIVYDRKRKAVSK